MLHLSSGRHMPLWSYFNKSLLWVKKGSRNHKLAIRGEQVRKKESIGLYYRYALGWR